MNWLLYERGLVNKMLNFVVAGIRILGRDLFPGKIYSLGMLRILVLKRLAVYTTTSPSTSPVTIPRYVTLVQRLLLPLTVLPMSEKELDR